MPKLLVCCEESQRVCMAFRERGWEAYSCDIEPCSGEHHVVQGEWDLLICHPPCTYLSNAGARHLWRNHTLNEERYKKGLAAKSFFMKFINAKCEHIVVENPCPSKIYELPPYSQTIQPYDYYGELHPYSKRTCLWLKNLPLLERIEPTVPIANWCPSGSYSHKHEEQHKGMFTKDRAKNRSKTFEGVARAMADQWGSFIEEELENK